MRRDNFDVLDAPAAVAVLVFQPRIRHLNVPIFVRQVMFLGPSSDGFGVAVRTVSWLSPSAVVGLNEPLIFTLQLFLEDDSSQAFAELHVTLGRLHVCGVNA
jgi:hypothetical protein